MNWFSDFIYEHNLVNKCKKYREKKDQQIQTLLQAFTTLFWLLYNSLGPDPSNINLKTVKDAASWI